MYEPLPPVIDAEPVVSPELVDSVRAWDAPAPAEPVAPAPTPRERPATRFDLD